MTDSAGDRIRAALGDGEMPVTSHDIMNWFDARGFPFREAEQYFLDTASKQYSQEDDIRHHAGTLLVGFMIGWLVHTKLLFDSEQN